jgi:16S rRNA (cytidine1402-2'-O)-methyltransferase
MYQIETEIEIAACPARWGGRPFYYPQLPPPPPRGPLSEVAGHWAEGEVRGEVVVVLEGAAPATISETAVREAIERRLGDGETVRDAVSAVADELRVAHRIAYDVALRIRSERGV